MLEARSAVRSLHSYRPPLAGRQGLRFDFNENTVGCSPRVLARLRSLDAEVLARYPEREPVEQHVATFLSLEKEQVLLTNGVDEAIHVLFETFLGAGDELLLPVPTYTMYEVYASATDACIVTVQAAGDLRNTAMGGRQRPRLAGLANVKHAGRTRRAALRR